MMLGLLLLVDSLPSVLGLRCWAGVDTFVRLNCSIEHYIDHVLHQPHKEVNFVRKIIQSYIYMVLMG